MDKSWNQDTYWIYIYFRIFCFNSFGTFDSISRPKRGFMSSGRLLSSNLCHFTLSFSEWSFIFRILQIPLLTDQWSDLTSLFRFDVSIGIRQHLCQESISRYLLIYFWPTFVFISLFKSFESSHCNREHNR